MLALWALFLIVISAAMASPWLDATLQGSITARISAKGSDLMPLLSTILLVNLAAILTIALSASLARKIVSSFALALSVTAIWLLIAFLGNPLAALANTALLKKATGISDPESQLNLVSSNSLTSFSFVCLMSFFALVIVQVALIALSAPKREPNSKYERQKSSKGSDHPIDLWDAQE